MTVYIVRRFLQAIPTLIGVYTVIFALAYLMPGDPVRAVMGESFRRATPETIEGIRQELGLNDPFIVQYLRFLGRTLRFDLGQSYVLDEDVNDILGYRLPNTIQLMIGGLLIAVIVGVPVGIWAAEKQNTWIDYTFTFFAVIGVSMPIFWQAILAKMFLTQDKYGVALFPVSGFVEGQIQYYILPWLILGLNLSALIARVTRASMLEVRSQNYIVTARAKGLHYRMVLLRHQLRNALIPVITVIALDIAYLLGGSVVTETVFSWPGLGRAVIVAIQRRDTPVIVGVLVFGAVLFMVINLITDIIYAFVDPRIRLR
jgi:peptide/nickel transport system permease protein